LSGYMNCCERKDGARRESAFQVMTSISVGDTSEFGMVIMRTMNWAHVNLILALAVTLSSHAHAQTIYERANAETVRLQPSMFPELPAAVRQDLERRACTIPQVSPFFRDSQTAHNVIRGAFTAAGSSDWAVLCSVRDTSRILIYQEGGSVPSHVIGALPDIGFQQGTTANRAGYSRMLSSISAPQIRLLHSRLEAGSVTVQLPSNANHDGINDAYAGKGSSIHYRHLNTWLLLAGSD
jgi:hypothetical protein